MTTKETYTSKYYIDIDICIYFVHLNIKKFINTFEKKVKWLEKFDVGKKIGSSKYLWYFSVSY